MQKSFINICFGPPYSHLKKKVCGGIFIKHELFEAKLVSEGLAQEEAHIVASKKYNYTKMSDEYYAGLGINTSDSDIVSGAIHRLSFKTH